MSTIGMTHIRTRLWLTVCLGTAAVSLVACALTPQAEDPPVPVRKASAENAGYRLQPGDRLFISVWREESLQRPVLVRPDGGLSFPLAGQIQAAGMTLRELEQVLQRRLSRYIPEATVSVALMETTGNKIYVAGKVIRPGEYVVSRPIDVMQAIALAGGVTPFADTSQIRVLRGQDPKQEMFSFNYQDIVKGRLLSQNITLAPGDTVVVP